MVEKVDLFPERLDNGRYVKGVTFKFPVMLEGEMTDQWWYKQNPVETVVQLSKGRWTSGGRPFSADRSGAKTISSDKVRVEFSLEDMER